MTARRLEIPVTSRFSLRATIRSHGWSDLPPFCADAAGDELTIHFQGSKAVVTQAGPSLRVRLDGPARRKDAIARIRSCLRMDLDLDEFWGQCRTDPRLRWVSELGAGRFLRAPTVFADAAMILATTNCSWALTRKIVGELVRRYGDNGSFPSKERLAAVSARELRRRVPLGYRAPFFAELARGPDLEDLRTSTEPTDVLFNYIRSLKGFGDYAAGNLLRSLGRFEHLALDSWVVARWKTLYPRRKATEVAIARHMNPHGRWRGLALWLLLTEHWYQHETWRDKFAL